MSNIVPFTTAGSFLPYALFLGVYISALHFKSARLSIQFAIFQAESEDLFLFCQAFKVLILKKIVKVVIFSLKLFGALKGL